MGGNTSQSNINNNKSFLPGRVEQVEVVMPPAYTDLFSTNSGDEFSIGAPPSYYSATHFLDTQGDTPDTLDSQGDTPDTPDTLDSQGNTTEGGNKASEDSWKKKKSSITGLL